MGIRDFMGYAAADGFHIPPAGNIYLISLSLSNHLPKELTDTFPTSQIPGNIRWVLHPADVLSLGFHFICTDPNLFVLLNVESQEIPESWTGLGWKGPWTPSTLPTWTVTPDCTCNSKRMFVTQF